MQVYDRQPPHPSGISWAFEPPPLWNFQFPLWWGYGYFLEPHIGGVLRFIVIKSAGHICVCGQNAGQGFELLRAGTCMVIAS